MTDLRARLADARLYLCMDSRRATGDLVPFLDAVLSSGVDVVQGADVLHLGQDDLPVSVARRILGPGPVIGRSSHSPEQSAAAAIEEGVDYFCAGPVWETPTKAGRPGTGTGLLTHVALLGASRPWFAIGGISFDRLNEVLEAGATRVVVVRAITEADDPGAAAAGFAKRLRAA
jgi:thiamine-phosphate pyrophosphorylase